MLARHSSMPYIPKDPPKRKTSYARYLELLSIRTNKNPTLPYPKLFQRLTSYKDYEKQYVQEYKLSPRNRDSASNLKIDPEQELNFSIKNYEHFMGLMKSKSKKTDRFSLEMQKSEIKASSSRVDGLPSEVYSTYRKETMHLFKRNNIRIKKVKESLKAAKRLNCNFFV
jgi:hypothetical protein